MNENLRNALPHKDTPFLRVLHIILAVLILLQIVSSNLTESDALSDYTLTGFVTWFHVITGLSLIVLGLIMLAWMLTQRGFHYYFAWLTLDFRGRCEQVPDMRSSYSSGAHPRGTS
jgi:hypothetical protein